ncbi:hypothetical protein DSO57_1010925 [Entomophthora muscae]|uniref:Uncharacterized protein n=1 Tax=Entomophthora muscae TaxID=34485 RepID=A0ACC2SW04_9FUNG|nr:hypothetical protein DSO57_1010925 [Entomophthora muscae]
MAEVEVVEEDQFGDFAAIQTNSVWGLARLSSATRLPEGSQHLSYIYDPDAGKEVDVYVIDSGIKIDHPEFGGRALWGVNFANKQNTDEYGHGTHVAGIIGSTTYGVVKSSTLFAVKVGSDKKRPKVKRVIAGIDWVLKNRRKGKGCVINLSLSTPYSDAFSNVLRAANNLNCVVTAAAGNRNMDACNVLPASCPKVITVGASTSDDARAKSSSWGKCLNVFAPGEQFFLSPSRAALALIPAPPWLLLTWRGWQQMSCQRQETTPLTTFPSTLLNFPSAISCTMSAKGHPTCWSAILALYSFGVKS